MTSPCWEQGREGTRKTLRFLKPTKNCRQPKCPSLGPWFISYSTSIGCPLFLEGLRLLSYKTATKPPSHWLTARMQCHIIREQSSAHCRTQPVPRKWEWLLFDCGILGRRRIMQTYTRPYKSHQLHVPAKHLKCGRSELRCVVSSIGKTWFGKLSSKERM